jgi:hypothetical protein
MNNRALTDSDMDQLTEKLNYFIHSKRLEAPAILCLEMVRPFTGSLQVLTRAFLPIISAFLGEKSEQYLLPAMEDPKFIDRLMARLQNPVTPHEES